MALELKTPPASEPVTLAEAKAFLNIGDTAQDAWVTAAVGAMRQMGEHYTRRAWMTQTWTLWLDAFPHAPRSGPLPGGGLGSLLSADPAARVLTLPKAPLQSVAFVKTRVDDGTATEFAVSHYWVDTASEPGRVVLHSGHEWPTGLRAAHAVEVEFTAGYGQAADVPEALKQGLLLALRLLFADKTWLFEGGQSTPGLVEFTRLDLPSLVRALWDPYRLPAL